jgi:GGDEF domain-containing protein
LISIRKSVSELEKCSQMQAATVSGYAMAICAVGEYAVQLDPVQNQAQFRQFRQNLSALQKAVVAASEPEDFQAIQASLRSELRDYRDKAQECLVRMRAEMQDAADAMQALTEGVATSVTDHKQQLEDNLQTLRAAAESEDLAQVRTAIRTAIAGIEQCCEQVLRANQVMIAQFNDEIRSLHREMDNERKLLYTDRASGAWNRKKIETRIEDLLDRGEAFCVVIARMNSLKRLGKGVLKELVKRANGILGRDAMFGRWKEDEFAVIVEANTATAIAISSELSRVMLRITTVVVEQPPGGDPDKFRQRLKQASDVLHGA